MDPVTPRTMSAHTVPPSPAHYICSLSYLVTRLPALPSLAYVPSPTFPVDCPALTFLHLFWKILTVCTP